ncbi:MAG: hypothetical protein LLF76_08135 [Planctomycetaceae bacterium]|nr:hypothetical protein [Planctomycetaceae bacterium]
MFCTKEQVKERLGLSSKTEPDAVLTTIISGIAGVFQSVAERPMIVTAQAVTECYTGLTDLLQVQRYPIVSVTSIKESWDRNFANATALVANTDYWLLDAGAKGLIERQYTNWLKRRDGIQIVYRGGYCAAGATPQTGEIALPADINEAAIHQACFFFKRKDDPGLSGIAFEGGSFQKYAQDNLLPMVRDVVLSYKRLVA